MDHLSPDICCETCQGDLKLKKRKIFFIIMTICLTICILLPLERLLERKTSIRKYRDFLNSEYNYDILFVGTSHVINGIFPMELWKQYGITSYNFGNDAATIPTSYWMIMNALNYTSPELIVLDCYGVSGNTKVTTTSFDYIHSAFDAFPLSIMKLKAAMDLTDDPNRLKMIEMGELSSEEQGDAFQLLWKFSVYHSRWNDLKWYDFSVNYTPELGAESRVGVAVPEGIANNIGEKASYDTIGFQYLNYIIEECNKRDIKLLLTYLPFPANNSAWKEANAVSDFAKNKNIPFVNFLELEEVNYQTDLYDSASHLNPSGAKKVTEFIGRLITEQYDIEDHRNNVKYSGYWKKFDEYQSYKEQLIKEQTSLENYLMLLSDPDFDIKIQQKEEDNLWSQNEKYAVMLGNIGNLEREYEQNEKMELSTQKKETPDMWITVKSSGTEEPVDRVSVFADNIIHE